MPSYENLLSACVRYIEKHGKTQPVIDRMETMLPGAWCHELIADAIDIVDAKKAANS